MSGFETGQNAWYARTQGSLAVQMDEALAEALAGSLDEGIELLREMPDLDLHLENQEGYEARWLAKVAGRLDAAFERREMEALYEVHRALFLLYELHVADPGQVRCANQFNGLLTRLRGTIERRWLAAEARQMPALPVPTDADGLIAALKQVWREHPVAQHPIFDFLERDATRAQVVQFFQSDSALNIRFFDLIALSLVGSRHEVRKELAQNFWDEAGRGEPTRSHVSLFRHLLDIAGIGQAEDDHASVLGWQGLAGYNLFMLGCLNRQHYYKSLGVLSMTELLDPSQYEKLARGCRRVGFGVGQEMDYYDEHISIDVVHGEGWLVNVIKPVVERSPSAMADILAGAYLRLTTCQDYYDDLYGKLMLVA
jgi:hypothetical protein